MDHVKLYGGGDYERDRRIRQRRADKIERFTERQRLTREWINFEEIAKWCSELNGSGVPDEAARETAYRNLECDLLMGDFEENGRSQVLFLHPGVAKAKMTRSWMQDLIVIQHPADVRSEYLDHCWIPRESFQRWTAKHHLPSLPARFMPRILADAVRSSGPSTTRAKAGAKSKYDWEDIEQFVFRELNNRGDFNDSSNATKGWQSFTDLYERIIDYVERLSGSDGAPAISTLKGRVPAMVDRWRTKSRK